MKRRWKLPVAVFSGMFLLLLLIVVVLPNQYESHLKLLVKNERLNPMVSSGQPTQGVTYVNEVSEARINTEIELLTSRDVLQRVVDRCSLAGSVSSRKPPALRNEIALDQLRKDLTVTAVRKSDVIDVRYRSRDAGRAERVLRALADVYLDAHLNLHGAPGSEAFLADLSKKSAADLTAAEDRLNGFRASHHVTSIPDEKALLLQQISSLEKGVAESSAAATRAGEQSAHLGQVVATTPQTIEKERQAHSDATAAQQLEVLLVTLRNKRSEIVQRYRPDDRVVVELDAQIEQTSVALLAAQKSRDQQISTGINPTFLSAQGEYLKASSELVGSKAESSALGRELSAARARLLSLDAASGAYDDLQRQVTELEAMSVLYKRQSDQAHVDSLLDRERIANVTVAEQPSRPVRPASPKRGLLLFFSLLWSLVAASGVALALDLLTDRVSTPFELEEIPDLPLLASVPAMALTPQRNQAFSTVYASVQRRLAGGL